MTITLPSWERLSDVSPHAGWTGKWPQGGATLRTLSRSAAKPSGDHPPNLYGQLLTTIERYQDQEKSLQGLDEETYEVMLLIAHHRYKNDLSVEPVLEDFANGAGRLTERFKAGLACFKEYARLREELRTVSPEGDRRVELWEGFIGRVRTAQEALDRASMVLRNSLGPKARKALQDRGGQGDGNDKRETGTTPVLALLSD